MVSSPSMPPLAPQINMLPYQIVSMEGNPPGQMYQMPRPQQNLRMHMQPPQTHQPPPHMQLLPNIGQIQNAVDSGSRLPYHNTPSDQSTALYQFVNVKDEDSDELLRDNKPLSEKAKNRRRASQNLASRNYRQRKKEYINTMEDKMSSLTIEVERLRREANENKHLVTKLLRENANLKSSLESRGSTLSNNNDDEIGEFSEDLVSTELDLQQLITKLETHLNITSAETPADDEFIPTLKSFYETLRARHGIFTNQVKQIVNPCTQAKISMLDIQSSFVKSEQSDKWWLSFIEECNLNSEQQLHLTALRNQHDIGYEKIRRERTDLNREIKKFYNDKLSSFSGEVMSGKEVSPTEVPEVIELTGKLDALRQNLEAEKALILGTHDAISKILTPRQEAVLVTKAYNRAHQASTDTIQMLGSMWSVVSRGNMLAKLPSGSEWEAS
eukprot:TRINITY_DN5895_c0_g1_i1.p1 TRINITY_DN5895_c0_g1~~TRINITY_DN5895_c0_g1_i1.p1  ORF type:complete len:515 (-),score=104.05 TRINITY_DN5895_c0_g1_i1:83-1408(-)